MSGQYLAVGQSILFSNGVDTDMGFKFFKLSSRLDGDEDWKAGSIGFRVQEEKKNKTGPEPGLQKSKVQTPLAETDE